MLIPVAGPVGTVKKPSVVGEVFFKPRWESASFADFHPRRQFPQAAGSFFFGSFFFLHPHRRFFTGKFRARLPDKRRSRPRSTPSSPSFSSHRGPFGFPK